MTRFLIKLINIYQFLLSPDHSPQGKARHPYGYCRFYPTCSEYAKQALVKYGLWGGVGRAAWRILRCNPFTRPTIDQLLKSE
jgi:hypothetical protein